MESVKFYCESKPKSGEIVQVIFTSRHDDHTEGHLTEYNGSIIMVHSQATTKKKIKSFNKVIPLNKPIAAIVEEFSESKNNGSVSRAYLKDVEENYSNKFVNNGKLFNGIYQICEQTETNFKDTWENKVFPYISKLELEEGDTYLDAIISNLDDFVKLFENQVFVDKVNDKFKFTNTKKEIYKKKVGIIANDGVESTKRLISSSLEEDSFSEFKDSINVTYFNTPNYMVETDVSNEVLEAFIGILQENSKKMKNVFVKVY